MSSFSGELRVGGHVFPLLEASYRATQATDHRGRVIARVRRHPVELLLDVPRHGFLEVWAHEAHKRLPADVVFRQAAGGSAWETLRMAAAYCVEYSETFHAGDDENGAYVCRVVLADPDGWTLHAGDPAAYVAPAARDHGVPPVAALAVTPATVAGLTKKQRYDARMGKLAAARAHLTDQTAAGVGPLVAPADATRVAPAPGKQRYEQDQNSLRAATDRLAHNNVAVERAKLADDSYNNDIVKNPDGSSYLTHKQKLADGTYVTTQPPEGWAVKRVIKGEQSGFMAVVYQSDFEQPPRTVVAFRGTDADPNFPKELKKDGITDALQGMGFYTDA